MTPQIFAKPLFLRFLTLIVGYRGQMHANH